MIRGICFRSHDQKYFNLGNEQFHLFLDFSNSTFVAICVYIVLIVSQVLFGYIRFKISRHNGKVIIESTISFITLIFIEEETHNFKELHYKLNNERCSGICNYTHVYAKLCLFKREVKHCY